MTLINVANCLALTFVPPWIIYKSKLEDYAVGWAGYQAGSVWLGTQLLQMILTATFVPSASLDTFDLTQELMKAFITLADVLGLFYIFQQKKTAHGAASVGLSWSVTESCTRRFFPMVFSAQSIQFTWDHSIAALEANVGIATHMCFAVLVWMYMRKPHMRHTIAVTIIVQRFAFPIVSSYLAASLPELPFVAVSAQFGMSLVLAYATRAMLSANDQTRS